MNLKGQIKLSELAWTMIISRSLETGQLIYVASISVATVAIYCVDQTSLGGYMYYYGIITACVVSSSM